MRIRASIFLDQASQPARSNRRWERGILLIECIAYLGLFFAILGVAFCVFYHCWDNSKALRRNTDDIARALKTGERWREDVRRAAGPLRVEDSPAQQLLRIPQKSGEVLYRFSDGGMSRRAGNDAPWMPVLAGVKSSQMRADRRAQAMAWRWELELATRVKSPRVRPLFTFSAVSPTP